MDSAKRRLRERTVRKQRWEMIFKFYGGKKCHDCGLESKHPIYDLHHRDPATKSFEVGRKIRHRWEKIEEELRKCDLLCSNCHRIRHHVERKHKV